MCFSFTDILISLTPYLSFWQTAQCIKRNSPTNIAGSRGKNLYWTKYLSNRNILFLRIPNKRDINYFMDPTEANFIDHNHQGSGCNFINITTESDVFWCHKAKLLIYFIRFLFFLLLTARSVFLLFTLSGSKKKKLFYFELLWHFVIYKSWYL